jgi:hypothetical protein
MNRIGIAAVGLLAAAAASLAFRARLEAGGTPNWDSASHGLQGYAVAQDVARIDVPNLLADTAGHRYRYPPGHPILLAAAYVLFGGSWATAFGVSALLFGLLAVVLYATAESPTSGWIAALLALSCPALLDLSGQILLEIPAAILMTLALRLYARSLEDDGAVRALGVTLTLFMLTAAQYAACCIVILGLFEAWRTRATLIEIILRFVRSRALYHPVHVLIALAVLTAIAVRVTGGWTIPIGSRTLSMTRAGGPLIAAFLLLGGRVAWVVWKRRAELRITVPKRYKDIFITAAVPIYLWVFVIYPPRFQQFAEWVARPPVVTERTDPAHWTFYPDYFLDGGHAGPIVAVAVLALALAAFIRRDPTERVRFLRWAAVAGALLVMAHHARQVRFLVPFLPAFWILAAETLASAFPRRRALLMVGAAIALFPAGLALYGAGLRDLVGPPAIHRAYEPIPPWAIAKAQSAPAIRVVGGFEGLSRHLFEWELRRRVDIRTRRLDFNLELPEDFDRDPEGPRKVFDAWLAGSPENAVVVLEPVDLMSRPPRPVDRIRKSDPDWPEFTMRFLRESPKYRVADERVFDAAGIRVRIYRRVS